jgi:hypothetical protein
VDKFSDGAAQVYSGSQSYMGEVTYRLENGVRAYCVVLGALNDPDDIVASIARVSGRAFTVTDRLTGDRRFRAVLAQSRWVLQKKKGGVWRRRGWVPAKVGGPIAAGAARLLFE